MSKKVKNGLVDEVEVIDTTTVDNLPTQKIEVEVVSEEGTPGHGTRAFRA
jgi:hypothetical protein